MQADSVEHLRKLPNVASGGVVLTPARPRLVGPRPALRTVYVVGPRLPPFTTIQKFAPERIGGRNAGEGAAGLSKAPLLSERRNIVVIADEATNQYDLIDGLARNLRDSLPQASCEVRRMNVKGRKLGGKATVPIYYESRVAKLG